jgi:hypothetical protein
MAGDGGHPLPRLLFARGAGMGGAGLARSLQTCADDTRVTASAMAGVWVGFLSTYRALVREFTTFNRKVRHA